MQTVDEAQLTREAIAFTRYLISEDVDAQSIELYSKAQQKLNITLSENEDQRLNFMLNHAFIIGMIDGALALQSPQSGIRKKIYIMLAILESDPNYAKHFLPQEQRSPFLQLIGLGIKAAFNTLTGLILLPWI